MNPRGSRGGDACSILLSDSLLSGQFGVSTILHVQGNAAEQWMLWTPLYSPLLLFEKLLPDHFELWSLFSQACSLLCSQHLPVSAVIKADELLLAFCAKYQETYGEDACTPNMHMHCHLGECVKDVGPIHSFWCFPFERYNGILQKMKRAGNHQKSS